MPKTTKRERYGLLAIGALLLIGLALAIYDPAQRRCEALGGTRIISGRCMIVTESRMLVPWHPSRDDQ